MTHDNTDLPEPMAQALTLAQRAIGLSEPNPRVGCVLTGADGQLLGQGHTQAVGGPHAEVMALRDAQSRGHATRGATAYVTLEPCAHHGRTGPCCDALIAAGVARVVVSIEDPNPQVAGQGLARMRAAGIAVTVGPGAAQSRELNIGFFSRMLRRTPWVRLKLAASLDGMTALDNGASQWITSEPARTDGHAWRARADVILTGIGTVRDDDPRLDVRLATVHRQPGLVVVDSRLETPPQARLFEAQRSVTLYAAQPRPGAEPELAARGARIVTLPGNTPAAASKVDLRAMLADLARTETNEIHVEAGHKLNGSLIREGLVDELLVYLAPKLIGQGRSMAAFGPLAALQDSPALRFGPIDKIGPDLRILARFAGKDEF
ncbi:bifunctional diaminohydroxyphosphoribosylaminopyrimidine deaminase/5-amino-6-(5-phosphoribosylamino)uracil reductase RibD [Comamonadaceae bacterium G21597-S1]|nr:bifunctional diaminohydroxyphosphoribosylaminopyrimidine deaminase/5-amino-6-(5-phosphoribosylamino)uracil reductase RibD [Comamonadaceae bacterium G21597-S1]